MNQGRLRERGGVLAIAVITVMMIFAVSGVVISLSFSEAQALTAREESTAAFFLAEGAVERAQWEFSELQDPGNDGMGNSTWSSGNKNYTVTTTEISPGEYLMSAVATVGGESVGIDVVVGSDGGDTKWPPGALTVLGEVDKLKFEIKKEGNLILDGGDTPAVRFSDLDTFQSMADDFADAINPDKGGKMPKANLTGFPTIAHNGEDIPLAYNPEYDAELKELTDLYDKLVAEVNVLKAAPDYVVTDVADLAAPFGDVDNPVTVYIPEFGDGSKGSETVYGQSISGYGNLIVGDKFKLKDGSSIDWTGALFVLGDSSKNAEFTVESNSTLNVDGSVNVLGESTDSAKFKIKDGSIGSINGSLFVGTDWQMRKKTKAELKVEKNGRLDVNGLMTMVGPRVKLEVKTKDGDGILNVNGIVQIGLPPIEPPPLKDCSKNCTSEFQFKIEGQMEIHRDMAKLEEGVNKLKKVGVELDVLPEIQKTIRQKTTVKTWKKVKVNNGNGNGGGNGGGGGGGGGGGSN